MKKIKIIRIISNSIKALRNKFPFIEEKQHKRVREWVRNNGDNTLRLDYKLNKHSVVFDLGGFKGQWASDIYSKYTCSVYIFEPYIPYFNFVKTRFSSNTDIKVFDFGLGSRDEDLVIYFSEDGTSIIKKTSIKSNIRIVSFLNFVKEEKIEFIDLIKINIEGAEYDVVDHICNNSLISKIGNLQIQFHDFFPDAMDRVNILRKKLAETHYPTYVFDFVWENWKLKENNSI